MSDPGADRAREVRTYMIGYGVALALTATAFGVVHWGRFGINTTLAAVFALGLVQVVVHFRCFLHIGLRKSSRDDLQLILFSTLIIGLMVSGTLVILMNLRQRMM